MASFRLAVPDSLRPLLASAPVELISRSVPSDERTRERWLRLWLERRAGAGATPADAAAALQSPSLRAVLAVLDRHADAALLDESEAASAAAWCWVEPRRGEVCTELWLAGDAGGSDGAGWWEAKAGAAVSVAAEQLRSAVAEMARLTGRAAVAAVVSLSGSSVARRPPADRFLATLTARASAVVIPVYSPLLFRDGRLQAAALLAEIRRHTGSAAPVLYIPQLDRGEIAAFDDPVLAGAEMAVARLRPDAGASAAQTAVHWLEQWR